MIRIDKRLALIALTMVAGFLLIVTSASAQVRRNLQDRSGTPPVAEPEPPATPSEEPATPSEEPATRAGAAEEGEEEEGREEEAEVDPEMVARVVEMRGPMWLLEQEPVRKELKITDAQLERLKQVNTQVEEVRREAFDRLREQMRSQQRDRGDGGGRGGPGGFPGQVGPGGGRGPGGFPGGGGFFPGGAPGSREGFRAMMTQMRQQSDMAIASVLSSAQRKRFQQILIQAKGPIAVAEDEEVMNALALLPVQREQMRMILQEMETKQAQVNNARRELARGAFQRRGEDDDENNRERRGIDPETQAKMDQLEAQSESYKKEAIQRMGKVLTRPQISQYSKLLGKKFDFSELDVRNVMRGGGGRGRQRR